MRDKLAKAVEESEYKLYEREQLIRREVQRELARRDKDGEVSNRSMSLVSGRGNAKAGAGAGTMGRQG